MNAGTHRILVVDDEADVRELVKDVLESNGYFVVTAENGRDAMRRLQTHPVDLVVIDLIMPEREGIETIQALRRDHPKLPILAISGSVGPYLEAARLLGANASLNKPFSVDRLADTVAGLVALQ